MNTVLRHQKEVNMMQANQLTIQGHPGAALNVSALTGRITGLVNRILGCWHRDLSRPFSSNGQTYRSCLTCGARRQFNLGRWEMQGGFYYSLPTSKHFRALNGLTVRPIRSV